MKAALAAALATILAAPAFGEAPETGRTSYIAAEKAADGVYYALRRGVMGFFLPERLAGRMAKAPKDDSYTIFRSRLENAEWRGLKPGEGEDVVLDAFSSTLVERYRLEEFGKASGAYALDPANWEPRFLASASVLGSAYLWAAGVDADYSARGVKVGLKLAPGWRWRQAAQSGGRKLARLSLSKEGSPLTLTADWGSEPAANKAGVEWSRRF